MGGEESKPAPPKLELDTPWREFDWGQKALKKKLENFSPSSPDVKDIKILVAGEVGSGKSSFINSVDSAFQGRITSRALAETTTDRSFTTILQAYTIRSENKPLPFVFKDIMGLEAQAMAGLQPEHIISTLYGHLKDGYDFTEKQALTKDQHYVNKPNLSDQAFCLVYVIPANLIQYTDDNLIAKLKFIRKKISEKGIPQVVVMTKVDEACPLVQKDLRKIYTSKKIKERMELCSAKTGVPLTNIFPVKNYHDEMDPKGDIDALTLKALEKIVQIANDKLIDIQS